MKHFTLLLVLFIVTISCQKEYNSINSANQLLPEKANSVIVINDLIDFTKSIENHDILSKIYSNSLKNASTLLKQLNTTRQVNVAFFNGSESDYLILTANDSVLFKTNTSKKQELTTESNIYKTEIDSTVLYHKIIHNYFAASNNKDILKALKTEKKSKILTNLISSTDKSSTASVIFKTNNPSFSKLLFSTSKETTNSFSVIDLNFFEKNITYNGIITSKDSIKNYLDCFKNTTPQKNYTLNIAPKNTNALKSITYDDFSVFNNNLSSLKKIVTDSSQTFLNYTNEIALIDNAILVHSLDADIALETIEDKTHFETYRAINIYEFNNLNFFKTQLQPFITFENTQYLSKYNDFLIFSNSNENLKSILNAILSNNTIANSEAYKNVSKNISDEASMLIYKNNENLSKLLETNTKGYDANVVQYIYENNYAHVSGNIQKFNKQILNKTVTEAFTVTMDNPIIAPPQTVKNHITKAHDIIVQDINNTLYLISNSGNILWKREMQGKILGKVKQIDMYKNGRLQLAFTTANRLYVIDRNGNDVSPFPLKFNNKITQPLSVFDYEKNKNYRLLVTQGKELLMYDAKGKTVKGFNYKNNNQSITTQPKHFRINNKDYITFATSNKLQILNRQGKTRISVEDKIRFSKNELYLHKNKFTSTNTLGELVQVDAKGKLSKKNLNLTETHGITTTSKTLVALAENKLTIKSKSITLDYGEYTKPRIFYIDNKIYVTTTDLQAKKVYLFDSQAQAIPNFPIFGTSASTLQNLDKEKGLELVTQVDDATIAVYKL